MDAACRSLTALPVLERLSAGPSAVPVAIIGAGRGGDCVPRRSGYEAFARAGGLGRNSRGGGGGSGSHVLAVAREAGHLQFLEEQTTLQRRVEACYMRRAASAHASKVGSIACWLCCSPAGITLPSAAQLQDGWPSPPSPLLSPLWCHR
jgi:hypothetical protein